MLPVVLYNGDAPWTATREMRELIAPVPVALEPCQPSHRALLFDERRFAVDELPLGNLMRAVVAFEQSRVPADLVRVVRALAEGRAEGLAAGRRAMLRRLAAVRFGEVDGERVDALLGAADGPERHEAVAELILDADSGANLVDRVERFVRRPD